MQTSHCGITAGGLIAFIRIRFFSFIYIFHLCFSFIFSFIFFIYFLRYVTYARAVCMRFLIAFNHCSAKAKWTFHVFFFFFKKEETFVLPSIVEKLKSRALAILHDFLAINSWRLKFRTENSLPSRNVTLLRLLISHVCAWNFLRTNRINFYLLMDNVDLLLRGDIYSWNKLQIHDLPFDGWYNLHCLTELGNTN